MEGLSVTVGLFLLGIVAQNVVQGADITFSVYTVTSKSAVLKWSKYLGATFYKLSANTLDSTASPVYSTVSPNTVMAFLNSLTPNTAYTFKVEALDSNLNVLANASEVRKTAPDIPTITKASSKQSQSITVDFTQVSGATSYLLRTETSDGKWSETPVSGSPGTVSGLNPYTDYILSVMSVNSGGRSQPSYSVQVKTVLPPLQLNSSSPSNNSLYVYWPAVPNALLYTISLFPEGLYPPIRLNVSNNGVTFNNLTAGTNYTISANAWGQENVPGDSVTIYQITRSGTLQSVVLQSTPLGVLVSWNPVKGASLYLASSAGLNCSSTSNSCTLGPQSCGETYTISVTAFNQAGPSQPSVPLRYISAPCAPDPISVDDLGNATCSMSWKNVSNADNYTAYSKRDDGIEETCNSTGTSCNFSCQCGYSYIMSVFANNQAGTSSPGPLLNKTTVPCCPTNVTVSLISWESLKITWNVGLPEVQRGVDMYVVRAVDRSNNTVVCEDTSTECVLSDLKCNTKYNVQVCPCNDVQGCNSSCQIQTQETAPCMPEKVGMSVINASSVLVTWMSANNAVNYTVNVIGSDCPPACQSSGTSCQVNGLSCGSSYQITVIASSTAGASMPSYSVSYNTAPCCPATLNIFPVNQAMSNVMWSASQGAQYFTVALTSSLGNATCHTTKTSCLMGCITCGTNYTVSLQAINSRGNTSVCTYHGFSSSECCPSRIRLYTRSNNTLRVSWSSSNSLSNVTAQVTGGGRVYACSSIPGQSMCDVSEVMCGNVYTVMVAPVNPDGFVVTSCPNRAYFVYCSGSSVGMVLYRGKRSLD